MAPLAKTEVGSEFARDGTAAHVAGALGRAEQLITARVSRVLQAEGCSVAAWRVLSLLTHGVGHPMSRLAEAALLPAPSLTRLVDRMVADNLVYRRADEHDRRRILVYATRRGCQLQRRLDDLIERDREAILGDVDAEAAEQIIALLDRLG